MSWITILNDTFDHCESIVGKKIDGHMLLPVGCTTAVAQIEVVVDNKSNFISARRLDKEEAMTVIFATEDSAARTSGNTPMPWHDKLQYVAGDYDDLVPGLLEEKGKKTKSDKRMTPYYEAYMAQLKRWVDSPYSGPLIQTIYDYLDKKSLIADLVGVGVFEEETDFVRFRVVEKASDTYGDLWETQDIRILSNFQRWYMEELKNDPDTTIGICYATGKETIITKKHPAKIRHTADRAKLISSNDKTNFTYRGRFATASEAVQVSYEATQKAHNTLRWLIEKQGKRFDSARTVCWSFGDPELPDWAGDTTALLNYEEEEMLPDTAEKTASEFKKAMAGYYTKLDDNARIYIMSVDTADGADQGRLAITYFSDLSKNDFIENMQKWHMDCMWPHDKYWQGVWYKFYGAPSANAIIRDAYGIERKSTGMVDVDDRLRKRTMERLLPCIIEGRRFPKDIMRSIVKNAGEPLRYSENNHKRLIEDACSVIQRCRNDDGKEKIDMALQEDLMDRSYLYGRLLAVFNRMETIVNIKKKNADRETNAFKLWSRYTKEPAKTISVLRKRINPYMRDLSSWNRERFSMMIEDILGKIESINGFTNESLKETYLLGYYSQMEAMRSKKEKENEEDENSDSE